MHRSRPLIGLSLYLPTSFRHAFNVTKAAWYIVDAGGFLPNCLLTDLDVFTLLLSALCHDLEHKGTTNAFETMTCSEHALRYNDVSVLENHHASVGFQLVDASNLLTLLDQSEFLAFRRQFLRAILSTGALLPFLSLHACLPSFVAKTCRCTRRCSPPSTRRSSRGRAPLSTPRWTTVSSWSASCAYLRSKRGCWLKLSLRTFPLTGRIPHRLHCADLCNPLFPPAVSQRIAAALSSEFDAQAERGAFILVNLP